MRKSLNPLLLHGEFYDVNMSAKDYYKVLGVSKQSGESEIKKAFRNMAMKYHPDRHKGDKRAEEKFKEVNEAYAVLSDPKKRKQYDMFGAEGFHQRFSQEDIFRNIDLGSLFRDLDFGGGDIFSQFFGAGRQHSSRSPFGQQRGGGGFDSGFDINGFQHGGMDQPTKGTDLDYELQISLEEAAFGGEKQVIYKIGKERKEVKVKIPSGIADGQKLRLAGKGLSDIPGLPPGDLFFNIKILDHPIFKREGNGLFMEKEIKFSEAVLGISLVVPTISGNKKMTIPPGTQCNTKMRLKGQGMPVFRGKGNGDLYIKLIISVPKKLTRVQKKLLQDMAKAGL